MKILIHVKASLPFLFPLWVWRSLFSCWREDSCAGRDCSCSSAPSPWLVCPQVPSLLFLQGLVQQKLAWEPPARSIQHGICLLGAAGSDSPAPRDALKAAPGDGALGTFSLSAGSCSACLGLAPRWLSRFAWSLGLVQTHLSCPRNLFSMLGISYLFDKTGLAPFCR